MMKENLKNAISVWSLENVKAGPDVFGEVVIEEFVEGNIPENKGIKVPNGYFNNRMEDSLIAMREDLELGKINLDQAVEVTIAIITDPANYSGK